MRAAAALLALLASVALAQSSLPPGTSSGGGTTYTGSAPVVVTGTVISRTDATTSTAGCVSAGTQSFSGAKTFLASSTFSAGLISTTGAFSGAITSSVASGSKAIGVLAGARIVTNEGTNTRYISDTGSALQLVGVVTLSTDLMVLAGKTQSDTFQGVATASFRSFGNVANGSTAIANKMSNVTTLSTAGAAIVAFYPDLETTKVATIDLNGSPRWNQANVAQPACVAALRGRHWYFEGGAGVTDRAEVCTKDAADAYGWRAIY